MTSHLEVKTLEMGELQWIASVGSLLIAFKCLLIPAYVSTDFEVHRNWMAVTWHRPIGEWYTEATSEWTLDYPPFFALFELTLAAIANFFGIDAILEISKTPKISDAILKFQRFSVIFVDVFYILSCALYAFRSPSLVEKVPRRQEKAARETCFCLLACLPSLLLIDSIHFQYNSMLTAIFLVSLYFLDSKRYILAALSFSVLLNFKHIYLYYALGYVFYYLVNFFDFSTSFQRFFTANFTKALSLGTALLVPFAVSLGPFFHVAGVDGLRSIATRLFPVSRGLTHAYWAPNFWALYNLADLVLYRVLKLLKIGNFEAPTYTSGLVQEYSHSVLPSVSPVATLLLVTLSSVTVLAGLIVRRHKNSPRPDFTLFAVLSSLSFFYFGYHVHEKAIILVQVPMVIFAVKDPKHLPAMIFVSTIASFTLFPLLFTPFEIMLKYAICGAYFWIQLVLVKRFTRLPLSSLLPTRHVVSFCVLLLVELYATLLHHHLFASGRLAFLPLMAISILNAVALTRFFASLVWTHLADGLLETTWQKARCRLRERLIRDGAYSVQTVDDVDEVRLVAGVDVSASKTNPDLVVIAMSVWQFPECRHVETVADVRLLTLPYIPQYLAIREADVVAEFVRKVLEDRPHLRPDVIMCDGFGQFHSRECGMACHVGALTGIPSIGIAKNLPLHSVYERVEKTKVDEFVDTVREVYKSNKTTHAGYIPFDIVEPVTLNVLRMGGSMSGVFVSAGYGIDLQLATQISCQMLLNNTTCEPIRAADLSSRQLIRAHFDGAHEKSD